MKKTNLAKTIFFSSLTLGFIQYYSVGLFSDTYLIVAFAVYFFIPLLIFAIPLQYFLNKKPKKFSPVYFLFYLLFSLASNFLIFYLLSGPYQPPLYHRSEIYFYGAVSGIVYWFWDSICAQKKSIK
ncbi:UPF0715 family protein [Bacillus glycinifermentans]|uniref:UPF0715 family protein n=1 Tax=Bacillus glycinifermentans TaxID=1664069 RepID=UPI00405929EE